LELAERSLAPFQDEVPRLDQIGAAVHIRTARPASARHTPVVSPETPQPMTSASARVIAVGSGLVRK
jgi:hypothetical protein